MILIKIGGGKDINLPAIIEDCNNLDEPFLIIHGANTLRDKILEKMSVKKKIINSISGYSSVLSDEDMIDTILMSYAGLQNKRIVELCQQNGINAIGLTGLDGSLIQGKRNKGIRIIENGKKKIVRDLSGKAILINQTLINLLQDNGYIPIITIPILDENKIAINSENDDIAVKFIQQLNIDKVVFLIEARGLLDDIQSEDSIISSLNLERLIEYEMRNQGRMKRKLRAIKTILETTECRVYIGDGRIDNPLTNILKGNGTIIQK